MDKEIKEEFRLMRVFMRDIRENHNALQKRVNELESKIKLDN